MKVYIHIGTPKTGTTEIQSFFVKNYQELLNIGICYPKSFRLANKHWRLAEIISYIADNNLRTNDVINTINQTKFKDSLADLQTEIQQNQDKIFLFSAEDIVWEFSTLKHIEIFKQMLFELGFDDIKIIIYLRDTLKYLISFCSEDVKHYKGFYSFEMLPQEHPKKHVFDYKWLCQSYAQVFGVKNLFVKLFEKSKMYENNLLKDFTKLIGISWSEKFILPSYINQSFNLLGIEIQKRLNEHLLENKNFNSLLRITKKYFENTSNERLKYIPQREVLQNYYNYFKESNEWVQINYFPNEKIIFSSTPDDFKPNFELKNINEKDLDDIVAYILEIVKNKDDVINNLKNSINLS